MSEKTVDLSLSVYELVKQYPEILDVMQELGFKDIALPGMLDTVGRFMTLPKGAKIHQLDLDIIRQALIKRGFEVIG